MTRVVAYLRVSTDKQADQGCSLDVQDAKARAYAALYDLELVAVEVGAGESAATLDRPALQRALGHLRARRADALLVVKLDRLTRSVRDLAALLEGPLRKRALLSIGEQVDTRSAAGRMVLNILTTIGQWEREAIGERTSAAMAHMRARGEYTGGDVPLGWVRTAAGELVPEPREREAIVLARRLRDGGMSIRAIAATMVENGCELRGAVTPGKVQRVLARSVV